jgi:hypothetical protein
LNGKKIEKNWKGLMVLNHRFKSMSIPKTSGEQMVVVTLGKSGLSLSGSQMYDYAKKHRICADENLPRKQTFYNAIEKLRSPKYGIIKLNRSEKRGNLEEQFWGLTSEGKKVYDNLSNIYSLIGYVPDWYEIITHCSECKKNIDDCYQEYKVDLENVLKNNYKNNKIITNREISDLFTSPKNMQEFIFWLLMFKESKIRLTKFEKQITELKIKVE